MHGICDRVTSGISLGQLAQGCLYTMEILMHSLSRLDNSVQELMDVYLVY